MARAGLPLQARPDAGPRTGAQVVAATRLLGLSVDALLETLTREALENPALTLRLALDEEQVPQAGRRPPFSLHRLAGLDGNDVAAAPQSLFAHVEAQVPILVRDPALRLIALAWLEGLEPSGWVSLTAAEVARRTNASPERAEAVLQLLQEAEPDGLFARSLSECLSIQLRAADELTPEMTALLANLPLLAAGEMPSLAEKIGVGTDHLVALIGRLRSLNPKPGAAFADGPTPLRAPDFLLTRGEDGDWDLQMGRWLKPTLELSSPEVGKLAGHLRRASVLATLVENRDRLVYKASLQAIQMQAAFLDGQSRWPKPLALADVARPLGVHDTSIGRIRNHVFIGDGRCAVSLRQFFQPAIPNALGPPLTPLELTARIRETRALLSGTGRASDEAIRHSLTGQSIGVSRRTVAKYRGKKS